MICRLTCGKVENETHLRVQMIHSSYKRRKRCSPNREIRDTGCSIFLLSGNECETSCMLDKNLICELRKRARDGIVDI